MSGFPRFFLVPQVRWIGGKRPWQLETECVYLSDVEQVRDAYGGVIRIPAGYQTDLASVPRIPLAYWRTGGKAVLPAIVHDWLYECSQNISRKAADDVFLEAMQDTGDPPWASTRWTMYRAVRLFAGPAWRRYRGRE
jgi:hypothetical protein